MSIAEKGQAPDVPFTVSTLTEKIQSIIEGGFPIPIWVEGEVSNFKPWQKGNTVSYFFTLKDESSAIRCALWANSAKSVRDLPKDGDKIVVLASLGYYGGRGEMTLNVRSITLHGIGLLKLKFEKLKEELEGAGYFKPERKKPIPPYPRCVAVITSIDSAAVNDFVKTVKQFGHMELLIYDCRMQGEGAAAQVEKGIELINEFLAKEVDAIAIVRGGGSIEDLWAFNERAVAAAIFDSKIPVVTGIGHETDFTIADFVADRRAKTPTDAAYVLIQRWLESERRLGELEKAIMQDIRASFSERLEDLSELRRRLAEYMNAMRLDALERTSLLEKHLQSLSPVARLADFRGRLDKAEKILDSAIKNNISRTVQDLQLISSRLKPLMRQTFERADAAMRALAGRLDDMSPLKVLSRGYSITFKGKQAVRSLKELKIGDEIKTKVGDGEFQSKVSGISNELF